MKQQIDNNPLFPVQQVYEMERSKFIRQSPSTVFSDFIKVKSTMKKRRGTVNPSGKTKNFADIVVEEWLKKTDSGEKFI